MATVLVTGANGFIGKHLTRALVAAGYHVFGSVRSPAKISGLPIGVSPVVLADIREPKILKDVLGRVDTIVHLAARVHVTRETASVAAEEHRSVNLDATTSLLDVAEHAGVRNFVFLSSVAVAGDAATVDDNTPPNPITPYGKAKLASERAVREFAERGDCSALVFRPPAVYGPAMRGNLLTLLKMIDRGLPVPVRSPAPLRTFLYVENLVSAVLFGMNRQSRGYHSYVVADEDEIPMDQLIGRIAKELGRPRRSVAIPQSLLRVADKAIGALSVTGALSPLRGAIRRSHTDQRVHSERLRQLGWRPKYDAGTGWHLTCAWYRTGK